MLKIIARLEHKIGERLYQLACDHDAPLGEVKDALVQFLGYITQLEKAHADQMKAQEEASQPQEEKKDEQQPSDS